ncbi:hypothetical protein J6590_008978 [Homalodisca vitripennis]|nr:hypothetical protein J6590_008978 [Homalodisca vitripennis]
MPHMVLLFWATVTDIFSTCVHFTYHSPAPIRDLVFSESFSLSPMSHRKCFRDAAHNATSPPLPPFTTHSRSRRLFVLASKTYCRIPRHLSRHSPHTQGHTGKLAKHIVEYPATSPAIHHTLKVTPLAKHIEYPATSPAIHHTLKVTPVKKEAHQAIDKAGETIGKVPGGKEVMGFGQKGPDKGGLAAKAQEHLGDVQKGTTFAHLQRDAMKK